MNVSGGLGPDVRWAVALFACRCRGSHAPVRWFAYGTGSSALRTFPTRGTYGLRSSGLRSCALRGCRLHSAALRTSASCGRLHSARADSAHPHYAHSPRRPDVRTRQRRVRTSAVRSAALRAPAVRMTAHRRTALRTSAGSACVHYAPGQHAGPDYAPSLIWRCSQCARFRPVQTFCKSTARASYRGQ